MAKWFRKLWIGLLSGTAALVSCNFISPSPKLYGPPPVDPTEDTLQVKAARETQRLQAEADSLEQELKAMEME